MATINVNIKAKQVVNYNQNIEVQIEDFEKIKNLNYDDVREWREDEKEVYNILKKYINNADVFDIENEFMSVSVTKKK